MTLTKGVGLCGWFDALGWAMQVSFAWLLLGWMAVPAVLSCAAIWAVCLMREVE